VSLLRLVRRNVGAHPARSALLAAFAALTLFLAVFLRSVLTTLDDVVRSASSNRLTVQSAVGLFAELPSSYRPEVEGLEGVASVARVSWFGGVYRDPSNAFPSIGVDLPEFLGMFPELQIPDDQRDALLSDPRGCLLGRALAERFGLEVGDPLPLLGTSHPLPGGAAWDFTVRAIYVSKDVAFPESLHAFSWATFDETRREADPLDPRSTATFFFVRVEDGARAADVAAAIDARYENGPQRTQTQPEQAGRAERISLLGQIPTYLGLVGGTSLVAMLLAVVNAMGIAARERRADVGILKSLGFRDRAAVALVLLESLGVVGLGGAAGTAVAALSVPAWRRAFGEQLSAYSVRPETVVLGCAVSVLIALLGALPSALRLSRVRPVEVLRAEE
jgi:putative ABC transport system permease protein